MDKKLVVGVVVVVVVVVIAVTLGGPGPCLEGVVQHADDSRADDRQDGEYARSLQAMETGEG